MSGKIKTKQEEATNASHLENKDGAINCITKSRQMASKQKERQMALYDDNMCPKLEKEGTEQVDDINKEYLLTTKQLLYWNVYQEVGLTQAANRFGVRCDTMKNVIKRCKEKLGLKPVQPSASDVTVSFLLGLIEKQCYKCALSGVELTPENTSLDHKVPLSEGGKHEHDNVWFLHRKVNAAKGTMSYSEFVEMCHKIADKHPRCRVLPVEI